jgi:hypothetical protein
MSEPAPAPPGTLPGFDATAIVDAAHFARGGVVASTIRDYADV